MTIVLSQAVIVGVVWCLAASRARVWSRRWIDNGRKEAAGGGIASHTLVTCIRNYLLSLSLSNVLLSHSNRWKQALVPEQKKDLELEVAGGPPEKAVINHCWTPEMEGCSWFMILRKAFIKIIVVKQSSQANLPECVVQLRLYTCIIRPWSFKFQIFVCKNVGTLC